MDVGEVVTAKQNLEESSQTQSNPAKHTNDIRGGEGGLTPLIRFREQLKRETSLRKRSLK